MIQRGGERAICLLENVQQKAIKPIIQATIAPGTLVNTNEYTIDEYTIYNPLQAWGYGHKKGCHSAGEYARDEVWRQFLR